MPAPSVIRLTARLRAPVTRRWKDRLPGIALALGVQGALLALLVYSLVVPAAPPPEPSEVIFLLPRLAPREPVVIDARTRPRPNRSLPAATSNLPPSASGNGITPTPAIPPPLRGAEPPPARAAPTPQNAPGKTASDPNTIILNPPSGVQDEKRWAEEKARAGKPADAGVSVGVGIGIVIQNPLCKLAWVLLGGGFSCEPANYVRQTTDEQFQKALDATNARKRALYGKPAPTKQEPPTPDTDAADPLP